MRSRSGTEGSENEKRGRELPQWCATRQEDSEILKSFVPPVEQLAGGFFTPLHSSSHGIQQEPSSEVSAEYVSCCSSGYKSLLR